MVGFLSTPDVSMEYATREYLPDRYELSPMYRGKEQLELEVCVFKSFPGSDAFFGGQLTHPITHEADIYKNDAKEEFIFKQDIFSCIQYKIKLANYNNKEVVPMLCYFLSSKEIMLNGFFELTPWNKAEMETFARDLEKKLRNIREAKKSLTLKKLFNKFKAILPSIDRDPNYNEVWDVLNTWDENKPIKSNQEFYQRVFEGTRKNIEVLKQLFMKHPEWISKKNECRKNRVAIVRAFEFGSSKNRKWFVMPRELESEMEKAGMDCTSIKEKLSKNPLSTWTLEIARKVEGADKVKFVKTTIKRARHRAAYIPTYDGKYCIPAADALTELLHDMISRRNLFRNINKVTLDSLIKAINKAIESFAEDGEDVCFVSVEKVKKLNEELIQKLEQEIPHREVSKGKETMKSIKPGDYSVQELRDQLVRLGISNTFPDIIKSEIMHKVYTEAVERKIENQLTTSDMFDMVERCQIICIAKKTEKISNFLHSQNSCEILRIGCESCQGL